MIKDYCDILIQTIDTMIQGANEPQRMEYTKSNEKLELNEEQDSMLLVTDPFVDMLQVEVYNDNEIKVDMATITLPLWSLTNKNVNFDLLGVEGEFTTSLKEGEEQIDGSYGIQMIVYGGNKIYTVQLDSSEMLGDIKNFNHMLQKKVFDLTGVSGISYIGIKVYNNTNINVVVNNLRLLVGYNLTKVEDTGAPLQLYSESDNLVYKTDFEDKIYEGEKQTLKVKYIYQEDGKYRAISYLNVDSLPATAQLMWYRYNPALPKGDMWGGPYWQNCTLGKNENLFSREFELNGELEQEKFKVVLLNADIAASTVTPIYSNEIVFTREKAEAEEYISELKMRLADGSGGGYPYYDFDQLLAVKYLHQSQIKREARIEFETGYNNVDLLKQIKSVTWSWPIGVINGWVGDVNGATLEQLESGGRASAIYSKFLEVDDEASAKLLLESLSKFNYQIPDFRDAANTDGNIECVIELIDGTKYQAFSLISLAVAGVSGTDYSIIARIVDGRGQMRRAVIPGQQFYLDVGVYDPKGEKIENAAIKASRYWANETVSGSPFVLPIIESIKDSEPDAIILECKIKKEEEKDLVIEEIVPIPVAVKESYTYLGPSKVMYSSEGNKPEYEDTPIQLKEDGTEADKYLEGVVWTIDGDFKYLNAENKEQSYGLAPKIYSNNYFQPVGVFDQIMTTEPIGVRGVIGNQTQWLQPIILYQNKYFSRVINGWDGALEINKEDGYILSSAYVAGGKDEKNTFTGAILGELGTIENGADSNATPDPERTGLFGYKEGAQTFGFKADGTGFIGASGRGRINFDGINGRIYSGNFDGFPYIKNDAGEETEEIDYWAEIKNFKNSSKGTFLDLTTGKLITQDGVFRGEVAAEAGKIGDLVLSLGRLMSLETYESIEMEEDENGELVATTTPPSFKVDKTKFSTSDFLLDSTGVGITFAEGNDPFNKDKQIAWRFIVGNTLAAAVDGTLFVKGRVEAESGKLGNWHIISSGIWYDNQDETLTQTSDLYFGVGQQFQVGTNTAWPQTITLSLKIKNNFGISSVDGTVYARGKIMATSGEIGNGNKKWIISSAEGGNSYIYSGSNSIASHGGIPSVDVNNIYIGTDGISCGSAIDGSGYDTVIKSGLITTIYQGNSATYIRPDGIYFSYSQYGDFSDNNPASSNVIGSLTRYGLSVNLQLQGSIKGVTSITATGNITTTGNIYGVVGDSSNKKDVYADNIYANYINNTVKIYNPNILEYQSLPNYINSIVSLNYATESELNVLQNRVTVLENKISNMN